MTAKNAMYPVPWRWEPNGASEQLVAANGTPILGGARIADPVVRVALLHALETAGFLQAMHSKSFTRCDRSPDCGFCTCCLANVLFKTMHAEIHEELGVDDDHEELAEVMREILAGSSRWHQAVSKLSLKAIAAQPPIDFRGCTPTEAKAIAAWANGAAVEMPERLVKYLDAVKGA